MPYGTINVDKVVDTSGGVLAPISSVFRSRIINGAMVIDQRNAGALVAGAAGAIYPVDRTLIGAFGGATGRMSGQRSTTVPSSSTFTNSLIATVTTTDASPSADYGYCVRQIIEGLNVSDLAWGTANAQSITLSFWVRSSVTGTYAVCFQNSDVARAYAATYVINTANTWEQKTITIAGDTSGTWLKTNEAGISVVWCLGGGTNRQAPSGSVNAWGAGTAGSVTITTVSGGVNLLATSSATFYITGVQLEKGSTATSFDYRPYGTELQLCQRYFELFTCKDYSLVGQCYNTSSAYAFLYFTVQKRATPTATLPATGSGANQITFTTSSLGIPSTIGSNSASEFSVSKLSIAGTGYTAAFIAGNAAALYGSGNPVIQISAEL